MESKKITTQRGWRWTDLRPRTRGRVPSISYSDGDRSGERTTTVMFWQTSIQARKVAVSSILTEADVSHKVVQAHDWVRLPWALDHSLPLGFHQLFGMWEPLRMIRYIDDSQSYFASLSHNEHLGIISYESEAWIFDFLTKHRSNSKVKSHFSGGAIDKSQFWKRSKLRGSASRNVAKVLTKM